MRLYKLQSTQELFEDDFDRIYFCEEMFHKNVI